MVLVPTRRHPARSAVGDAAGAVEAEGGAAGWAERVADPADGERFHPAGGAKVLPEQDASDCRPLLGRAAQGGRETLFKLGIEKIDKICMSRPFQISCLVEVRRSRKSSVLFRVSPVFPARIRAIHSHLTPSPTSSTVLYCLRLLIPDKTLPLYTLP